MQYKRSHSSPSGKPVLAALLIGLVLLLDAMAACPALHEMIHQDADQADHQCAVTLFAHGQVDSSVIDVAIPVPAAPVEFLPLTPVSVPNALVEMLPLGRGPPVSSSNS